ncbi:MAG: DUF6088 family protein [Saprospiraceae bacterium]
MPYLCKENLCLFCKRRKQKIMIKANTIAQKVSARIAVEQSPIILRKDLRNLGGDDQVGRALRTLVAKGIIIRIGYGIYARTIQSSLTGERIPEQSLPSLAKEALLRLGVEIAPSTLERAYNEGSTTQVPTGRMIAVKGRVSRKIGYKGNYVSYERISK